jgi:hypothetical protein
MGEIMKSAPVRYQFLVHPGADHGYSLPERDVYDRTAANNDWERIFAMFHRQVPPFRGNDLVVCPFVEMTCLGKSFPRRDGPVRQETEGLAAAAAIVRAYSGTMLAAFTAPAYFARSDFMSAANSSGVLLCGLSFIAASLSRTA